MSDYNSLSLWYKRKRQQRFLRVFISYKYVIMINLETIDNYWIQWLRKTLEKFITKTDQYRNVLYNGLIKMGFSSTLLK